MSDKLDKLIALMLENITILNRINGLTVLQGRLIAEDDFEALMLKVSERGEAIDALKNSNREIGRAHGVVGGESAELIRLKERRALFCNR